ncbi:HU family DNA-binding protein [Gordonia sp. OPL2]|nr:HU family DNA-binding protein [Gordonia sp. OPL2]
MNKAELIAAVDAGLGDEVTAREATVLVEQVVDTIVRTVNKGESVTIAGFGVFEKKRRAARTGRNPRTGEPVKVKARSVPAFRPGTQFRAIIGGQQKLPRTGLAIVRGAAEPTAAAKKTTKAAAAKKTAPAKKATAKTAPAKKTAAKRNR